MSATSRRAIWRGTSRASATISPRRVTREPGRASPAAPLPGRDLAGVPLLAADRALAAFFLGERAGKSPPPLFPRLTFRRGHIWSARFAPDGQTVVYGAAWDGKPGAALLDAPGKSRIRRLRPARRRRALDLFLGRARPFARPPLHRHLGEQRHTRPRAAVGKRAARNPGRRARGGLGSQRLRSGRRPHRRRADAPGVPDRELSLRDRGMDRQPARLSNGDSVAFIEHPLRGDDAGSLVLMDRAGKKETLSGALVQRAGHRLVSRWQGDLVYRIRPASLVRPSPSSDALGTIALDRELPGHAPRSSPGRPRAHHARRRPEPGARPAAGRRRSERDLSWLDISIAADLSSDGTTLLFARGGRGRRRAPAPSISARPTAPLPCGWERDTRSTLSPDKKWALAAPINFTELLLLPTGIGQARKLERGGIESYQSARFLPDCKTDPLRRKRDAGAARGSTSRTWRAGGPEADYSRRSGRRFPRQRRLPRRPVPSPDRVPSGGFFLYPVEGGAPIPIPGLEEGEVPIQWTADGRSLYVYRPAGCLRRAFPCSIYRPDAGTSGRSSSPSIPPASSWSSQCRDHARRKVLHLRLRPGALGPLPRRWAEVRSRPAE